jgi:hypothetical protein
MSSRAGTNHPRPQPQHLYLVAFGIPRLLINPLRADSIVRHQYSRCMAGTLCLKSGFILRVW